jgi:uncharacterized protein with GYD domain
MPAYCLAMARFVLAIGPRGNMRTTTTRRFPEGDYRKLLTQVPS